jgi:hypothetical protein
MVYPTQRELLAHAVAQSAPLVVVVMVGLVATLASGELVVGQSALTHATNPLLPGACMNVSNFVLDPGDENADLR